MCGPTLALRIGNPLASFRAKNAALLCFGRRCYDRCRLFGFAPSYCGGDFAGGCQQGTYLREPFNFYVDLGKN